MSDYTKYKKFHDQFTKKNANEKQNAYLAPCSEMKTDYVMQMLYFIEDILSSQTENNIVMQCHVLHSGIQGEIPLILPNKNRNARNNLKKLCSWGSFPKIWSVTDISASIQIMDIDIDTKFSFLHKLSCNLYCQVLFYCKFVHLFKFMYPPSLATHLDGPGGVNLCA